MKETERKLKVDMPHHSGSAAAEKISPKLRESALSLPTASSGAARGNLMPGLEACPKTKALVYEKSVKNQDGLTPPAPMKKNGVKRIVPLVVSLGLVMFGLGGWLLKELLVQSSSPDSVPETTVVTGVGESALEEPPAADVPVAESPPPSEPTPEERYNNGANAPSEPVAAITWYKKFADMGIVDATYRLGMSYYSARSVPHNFEKAVESLKKAAEQGHQEAAAKLAECYDWGVGVDANPEEAARWRPQGTPAPAAIGEPAEPVEDTTGSEFIVAENEPSLPENSLGEAEDSEEVSLFEDRSSLDPLIARMSALRCRHATSALYQRRLLTLLPMIRNGADVDITLPETKGNTALHYACAIGSLGITTWLLEHGADANAVTDKGATPLMCVGNDNRAAITQALLNHGARQTQPSYQSAPSYGGDRSSLDPLIARMRALRCRHADSALYQRRLLTLLPMIRNGADVNITLPETKGNTALHYSCAIGSLSITKWLLEHGADANAVTNKGATPLMCVGSDNRAAIIRLLRQYGAVR